MKWHIKLMRGGISLSLPPWKGLSLSQVFSSHTIYLERCKIQHQEQYALDKRSAWLHEAFTP